MGAGVDGSVGAGGTAGRRGLEKNQKQGGSKAGGPGLAARCR
jgi:hypothetical protein